MIDGSGPGADRAGSYSPPPFYILSRLLPSLPNINHLVEIRLINTENLLFEEFYRDIPPYAILSHRWEEEEVAFAHYPACSAQPCDGA